ncbi:MAG: hypothetical protein H0W78_08345 [Planctomycetes bacterium]|nr:hypothetical protein [Planctomycetota bacterium]
MRILLSTLLLIFLTLYTKTPGAESPKLSMVFTEGRLSVNGAIVGNDLLIDELRARVLKLGELGVSYNDFGYHSTLDSRLVFSIGTDKRVFLVGARMQEVADGSVTVSVNGKPVSGDASIDAICKAFAGQVYDLGVRRKEILTEVAEVTFLLNVDGQSIDYVLFQVTDKGKKKNP